MQWTAVPSPIGDLGVAADAASVRAVRFDGPGGPAAGEPGPLLTEAVGQLRRYFAAELITFADLPMTLGGTAFERAVWAYLATIPYGETRTYGQVAAAVGAPGGARAVGIACNRNPVPVLVPCHRVVGAGNKLVGFGGGLPRKRYLLELEARVSFEQAWS